MKRVNEKAKALASSMKDISEGLLGKLLEGNSLGKNLEPGAAERLLEEGANGCGLEDCARCGSCKARCPLYDMTGNEAFSPRGRLMLLRGLAQGGIPPSEGLLARIFSCTLCGRCDVSCPVGIKPTEFIYRGRDALRKLDSKRLLTRTALRVGLGRPALGMSAARFITGFKHDLLRRIVPRLPQGLNIPERQLKSGHQVITPKKAVGRVAVFAGCAANYLMPETGEDLISMLLAAGYEVVLPGGEVCCGMPLRGLGLADEAGKFAEKNLEIFGKLNVEAVVSPCSTCAYMLKKRYPELAGGAVDNAMDAVEFLLGADRFKPGPGMAEKAGPRLIWHEPCHLKYGLGFNAGPFLRLLNIDKPEDEGCCGFGSFLTDKETSQELLSKRVEVYKKDAGIVVTACPGCRIQLESGGLKTMHILELMEKAFPVSARQEKMAG
ncbi:MAG: (Fe-S)-binding protein [Nitrospiraceae bacterium]|nr:(Fe-S)-binding protein [Nitrospiraceae bacterium]